MNAEEYLKGLNEHDPVFEIDTDYEYTEQQLINFAERYHEKQLKLLLIGVVSNNEVVVCDYEKDSKCAEPSIKRTGVCRNCVGQAN